MEALGFGHKARGGALLSRWTTCLIATLKGACAAPYAACAPTANGTNCCTNQTLDPWTILELPLTMLARWSAGPIKSLTGFPKEAWMLHAFRRLEHLRLSENNMELKHVNMVKRLLGVRRTITGKALGFRGVVIHYRIWGFQINKPKCHTLNGQ